MKPRRHRWARALAYGQLALVGVVALGAGAWLASRDDAATAQAQATATSATTGAIVAIAGSTLPDDHLWADGASLARDAYPALFAAICPADPAGATAIGTANCPYGTADGATFYVPDLRGRTPIGDDDMGGTAAGRTVTARSGINGTTQGASGGAQSVALTQAQLPVHSHAISSNHWHDVKADINGDFAGPCCGGQGGWGLNGDWGWNNNIIRIWGAASYAGVSLYNAGSSSAHAEIQPTLVMNYAIKA